MVELGANWNVTTDSLHVKSHSSTENHKKYPASCNPAFGSAQEIVQVTRNVNDVVFAREATNVSWKQTWNYMNVNVFEIEILTYM